MKKWMIIALLAVAMMCPTQAEAQLKFGLKGGLNVSSMSFSSKLFKESNRAGFYIGPTIKVALPLPGLGIDASALYDRRDMKLVPAETLYANADVPTGFTKGEATIKQQYVSVPINLRYGIGLGSSANIFVFAGPQFSFLIGDENQSISEVYNDAKANWTWKKSAFSMNVGAGITLARHWQVSANYNLGLGKTGNMSVKDAVESTYHSLNGKKDGRNKTWQVGLAYYF